MNPPIDRRTTNWRDLWDELQVIWDMATPGQRKEIAKLPGPGMWTEATAARAEALLGEIEDNRADQDLICQIQGKRNGGNNELL